MLDLISELIPSLFPQAQLFLLKSEIYLFFTHLRRIIKSGSCSCASANSSADGIANSSTVEPSREIGKSIAGAEKSCSKQYAFKSYVLLSHLYFELIESETESLSDSPEDS